jgi:hypothetical protein
MFLSIDGGCFRISSSGTSHDVRRRRFLTLMVDASGSTTPAPPRGPPSTFLSVDGGRSQIYSSSTSQGGPPSTFFSVDAGRFWVYSSSTSQGVCRRRFLALMVGTPGSTAPTPPKGPTVDAS